MKVSYWSEKLGLLAIALVFFVTTPLLAKAATEEYVMASQPDESYHCEAYFREDGSYHSWHDCYTGGGAQALIPLGKGSELGDGTIHSVTFTIDVSIMRDDFPEYYDTFISHSIWHVSIYCYIDDSYAYEKRCPDWIAPNQWNARQTHLLSEFSTSTDEEYKYWTTHFDTDPSHGTNFDGSFPVRFNPDYYYQLTISDSGWLLGAWGTETEPYWVLRGIREVSNCTEHCYSNVLFLPGLKGSVLKSDSDTLWPPTILSNDIPQLALTEGGGSVNDVAVDGIINTFYTVPVYQGFSEFMDNLVADGTIAAWQPFPYDWRFSPEAVVDNGVKTSAGTVDIIEKIEELAASSKSGKVTIVAHSMGGLVGKALIKRLEDEGKVDLVDSFVMVGVPQLGTPQAVAALLHGDSEAIPGGFFLPGAVAAPAAVRAVAQNMPGPHSLLPSPRYFEEVADPPVTFDENVSFTDAWRAYWGETLDSFAEFTEFLTGLGIARPEPPPNNLNIPEVLRAGLVADASAFHDEYDNYTFPGNIRVAQVAGWGVPTTEGVEYTTKHFIQAYKPILTIEGDKTVVYSSAVSSTAGEIYFFNLFDYNKVFEKIEHYNLLNSNPIQSLIQSLLTQESIETDFITDQKPPVSEVINQLVVSTHSPVILGAYDDSGNFTGIDPNQDLSAEILAITEDIPGSSFHAFGESQYIFLPKEGSYTFVFEGVGSGSTTVEIEKFVNDTVIPVAAYSEIPVTPMTKATFVVNSAAPEESRIKIDENGDGDVDNLVPADGTEIMLEELITLLKEKIESLDIEPKLKDKLVKRIEKLEKKIAKQKKKQVSKEVINLGREILKKGEKESIAESDVDEILVLLDEIESKI